MIFYERKSKFYKKWLEQIKDLIKFFQARRVIVSFSKKIVYFQTVSLIIIRKNQEILIRKMNRFFSIVKIICSLTRKLPILLDNLLQVIMLVNISTKNLIKTKMIINKIFIMLIKNFWSSKNILYTNYNLKYKFYSNQILF